MFPSPMTFRFIEEHIHENEGTGSSKLDKITSLYFYRGRKLSQRFYPENFRSWVGAVDVSEPDDFSLHRRWGGGGSPKLENIFLHGWWFVLGAPPQLF